MKPRSLSSLFSPSSVAVVGASDDPRKWGNWLARGALRGESRRAVHLVNHRAGEVLGRSSYGTLAELPQSPELVVIAVPVRALSEVVDDALEAGARAIVAISAGDNASAGTAQRDALLAARVRATGAVLLGPNCLGVFDAGEQLELVTNPLPPGSIGLISQSGNLALELGLLAARRGLGFSRFVSLGNQADLGAAEFVAELASHPPTKLIALYVEDFRDGREFARACVQAAEIGKPVVAIAIERGQATARAVRSHTGALASEGAAIDAACLAAGVERVRTPQELIDVAQALLGSPIPHGPRVAVLCDGGGHGSVASALATASGLEIPCLDGPTAAALQAFLPATAALSNPVDVAGAAERDVHVFDRAASLLLHSGEVDAVLLTGFFGGYAGYGAEVMAEERRTAAELGRSVTSSGRPVVVHTMYSGSATAEALRDAGVPTYESIEQAVGALARLAARRAASSRRVPALPPAAAPSAGVGYDVARALLSAAGVAFVAQRTVTNVAEAKEAADEIGYPVALKALGRMHKSDSGGVVLDVRGDAELETAYAKLVRSQGSASFSVQRMARLADGVELLIGSRWDPRFGPIALVGSGGIHAEVLSDTAVALAPVSTEAAMALLGSLRAAPLLSGARGRPAADVHAAARALAALSRVAAAHPELAEIEVNPLLVSPSQAIALDARLVRANPIT